MIERLTIRSPRGVLAIHHRSRPWGAMLILLLLLPLAAIAQPIAGALGKPLASPDLDPGTVVVRVVAGKPSSPVIGADVTLTVNGAPRQARTDAGGRATFSGVPAGASVVAKVLDEEKKEVASDTFPVPGSGGTRVMLTTKPWQMGGGGGGDQAQMEPRNASGSPRLEQTYELGTLTVIATYDDIKGDPAKELPIALVSYKSDETMSMKVQATSATDGRVEFRNLDRSGNTIYFVLAQFPRNSVLDRAYGFPLQMDSRGGVHMILSAAKRASTEPPVDDLVKVQAQSIPTEAGKVRVVVNGVPENPATIVVYDLATKQEIARADAAEIKLDAASVTYDSEFLAREDLPAGFLGLIIHGGAAGADAPLDKQTLDVIPAEGPTDVAPLHSAASDPRGQAIVENLPAGGKFRVRTKVNGKEYITDPFTMGDKGAQLSILANWGAQARVEALIDVPHVAGRVLYAECKNRKKLYRTVPFQTLPTAGTQLSMYFFPRTLFTFQLGGSVEDQLIGLSGQFTIQNYSWFPYKAPGDGFVLPMPAHAKGLFVNEGDQADVSIEQGVGFRILRPIPPGGRKFGGGFSMPIDHGAVNWQMDLPIGTYNSSLKLLKTPTMIVDSSDGNVQEGEVDQGEIYQVAPITILPNQSFKVVVKGLPILPAWRIWVPRILGIAVILVLGAGITLAVWRRRDTTPENISRGAQREKLLEELVAIDRYARDTGKAMDDKTKRRRDTLITELEALWGDD